MAETTPRSHVDFEVAAAMGVARRLRPPMKRFVYELRRELRLPSLSRQAVYNWESGEARVPASALLAAARIAEVSLDQLMKAARQRSFSKEEIDWADQCAACGSWHSGACLEGQG
jgi:transcriptional regulator with XRE-family HTH domain